MRKLLCGLCVLCLLFVSAAHAETQEREYVRFTGAEAIAELAPSGKLNYVAGNAIDGELSTCWAYSRGETPGATISFYADEPVSVSGISFTPGYAKSAKLYAANNRVKKVLVTLSDGAEVEGAFEDGAMEDWATLTFDELHEVEWLRLRVLEVYPGDEYDDTCISEIRFFK